MKKTPLLIILTLALMLLASTQALASPAASSVEAKKTPGPTKTPHVVPPRKPAGKPEQSHGKPENYRGTIAAVDASSLTLTLGDGSSVDFGLTADTLIKIPGLKGGSATDLQVGMTAMVQAFRDENNALVARAVMAIPGKPTRTHHVGW